MIEEKLYIICYDICDRKRWQKVFKTLNGYGNWLQLSVFQCHMNELKKQRLISELDEIIKSKEDSIFLMDIGKVRKSQTKIISIGKSFKPIEKKAIIF